MKHLLAVLCLRCVGLACATSLENEVQSFLSRQQQFQLISAGAASNQPLRLDEAPHVDQKGSLLSVMKGLQGKQPEPRAKPHRVSLAAMKTQVKLQSNVGRLEDQVESWKRHDQQLEEQLAAQQRTVKALQAEQSKAFHDEMYAVRMWRDCKLQSCLVLAGALAMLFFSVRSQHKSKPGQESLPSTKRQQENAALVSVPPSASKSVPVPPETKQLMSSEVSKQLDALAAAVRKVNMPTEDSLQVAMQAIEDSELKSGSLVTETAICAEGEKAH